MAWGNILAGGLLGSARAGEELANNSIAQRQAVEAEQRAEAAWRQRFRETAMAKSAEADALLGIERQGRQATADAITRRLGENADAALAGRYADPEMGDTPLTPEQQSVLETGLKLQDASRLRDRGAFMQDSRNRLVAAVETGNADPISLANLDSKEEATAARSAADAARLASTTDVALARIEAATAKADAAAKGREQGKPPTGYRQTPDGNLEAIPGGPADTKRQTELNADMVQLASSSDSMTRLATAANQLVNHPGLPGIVGLKGKLPNMPGGRAADAQALLDTLKSQVAFGVLQAMRDASKTGGALGSVSDAEGKRLEANLAALDRAQSLEQFRAGLQQVIQYADDAKTRMRDAVNARHGVSGAGGAAGGAGAGAGGVTRVNSKAELDSLPAGTVFQAPDGSVRVKR